MDKTNMTLYRRFMLICSKPIISGVLYFCKSLLLIPAFFPATDWPTVCDLLFSLSLISLTVESHLLLPSPLPMFGNGSRISRILKDDNLLVCGHSFQNSAMSIIGSSAFMKFSLINFSYSFSKIFLPLFLLHSSLIYGWCFFLMKTDKVYV